MPKSAEEKLLFDVLKRWQKAESAAVALSGRIIENSTNPTIRLVAEIIQRDSLFHHRVQQAMVDHMDKASGWLPTEVDFEKVWSDLNDAVAIEDKFVELAGTSLRQLEGSGDSLRTFLITYLLGEEKKHKALLEGLKKLRGAD